MANASNELINIIVSEMNDMGSGKSKMVPDNINAIKNYDFEKL